VPGVELMTNDEKIKYLKEEVNYWKCKCKKSQADLLRIKRKVLGVVASWRKK
jgi:hypothetical protein